MAHRGQVIHARQGVEQGGFAGSARADDSYHQIAVEAGGDVLDHSQSLVALPEQG